MTLTIEMRPETEQQLKRIATERGLDASERTVSLLEGVLETEENEPKPRTGAELMDYLRKHGVIGSWADRTDISDSSEHARKLRHRAETREWD